MFGKNSSKFLAWGILVLLGLCFGFLFFSLDYYANITATAIFFFLVAVVILQTIEYWRHPEDFKDTSADVGDFAQVKPLEFIKDVQQKVKARNKTNKWSKLINTFVVILFFLIYGVSTPTKDNIAGFIFLVILTVILNAGLFYFNFNRGLNKEVIFKNAIKRDTLMIGIINLAMLIIFVVLFGINFSGYLKFVAIAFVALVVNAMLLTDSRNSKFYE